MADFEIIEADFQQYYNLDVSRVGFRRYARLLVNLPPESRMIQKYSDFKDWNWDKEMQAQILHALDILITMYGNAHRKKGSLARKAPKLVQPPYVATAKKKSNAKNKLTQEEKENMKAFFRFKNNQITDLEGDNGA